MSTGLFRVLEDGAAYVPSGSADSDEHGRRDGVPLITSRERRVPILGLGLRVPLESGFACHIRLSRAPATGLGESSKSSRLGPRPSARPRRL